MAILRSIILPGTYRDSVFLMKISSQTAQFSGAKQVSAMMATRRNKELFARSGLLTPEIEDARPDDLAVAIEADPERVDKALAMVRDLLTNATPLPEEAEGLANVPLSLEDALLARPESNLAVISVAGDYARFEAARALEAGLDVMLYSDNISIEDELALKRLAVSKNLLLMGPECGTAIVGGVPLAFANNLRSGDIGIVGASGTGIQEVTCLLDRCGLGISNAYGTGGRDLMDEIGGLSTLTALTRLAGDPRTRIVLVIGKTPGDTTRKKLLDAYAALGKPVFVRYIGTVDYSAEESIGVRCAPNLTELARIAALELAPVLDVSEIDLPAPPALPDRTGDSPSFLRGIFSGGTYCRETLEIAAPLLKGRFHTNTDFKSTVLISGTIPSREHTLLDMGGSEFTIGHPHPLVSPEAKMERIVTELCDPTTAVLLTDVVLGYGVAGNQAGLLIQALDRAAALTSGRSRVIPVVTSVCGTENDSPSRSSQVAALQDAGVVVLGNNAAAALYAARCIAG
jgi:FdrA protein